MCFGGDPRATARDGRGALLSGGKPGNRGGIGRPSLAVGASSRELYGDVLAQIAAVTGRYGGVGDAPTGSELIVTIVRTEEALPPR